MPPARWDPVDANISMLFTELPLAARPAAARAAGFAAVEVWWPFDSAVPGDTEVDGFERAVRDAGVQLVALNGFAGNMRAGDRGIVSWPGRQQEFLDNLDIVAGLGARLGCRRFNLLYGNRVEGAIAAAQDELAVQNLAAATRAARHAGAVVLLEPLSGAPQYPLRTADDVLGVVPEDTLRPPIPAGDHARSVLAEDGVVRLFGNGHQHGEAEIRIGLRPRRRWQSAHRARIPLKRHVRHYLSPPGLPAVPPTGGTVSHNPSRPCPR